MVNMRLRTLGSKGVQVTRQEDGVIGNLAVTRHLEESASHHFLHFLKIIMDHPRALKMILDDI